MIRNNRRSELSCGDESVGLQWLLAIIRGFCLHFVSAADVVLCVEKMSLFCVAQMVAYEAEFAYTLFIFVGTVCVR